MGKMNPITRFISSVLAALCIQIFFLPGKTYSQIVEVRGTEEEIQKQIMKRNAEYLGYADEFLDKDLKKTFATEHYVVTADHPKPEASEAIALAFEEYRKVYISIFEKVFPLRKTETPTHIILFTSLNAFRFFRARAGLGSSATTTGTYIPGTSIIVSHFRHSTQRDFTATLLHEGIHQLNNHLLYSRHARKSIWVDEGLANYFALMKLDSKGRLVPGKVDWNSRSVAGHVDDVQRALRAKKHIPLEDLISVGREEFHGKQVLLYYGESWLFVQFLLHYKDGVYRKPFTEYLMYEIEGMGGLESFKKVFGDSMGNLEQEFKKYVLRLH